MDTDLPANRLDPDRLRTVCLIGDRAKACSFIGLLAQGWTCLRASSFEAPVRRAWGGDQLKTNCPGPPFKRPAPDPPLDCRALGDNELWRS